MIFLRGLFLQKKCLFGGAKFYYWFLKQCLIMIPWLKEKKIIQLDDYIVLCWNVYGGLQKCILCSKEKDRLEEEPNLKSIH